jgi:hypothetical protein
MDSEMKRLAGKLTLRILGAVIGIYLAALIGFTTTAFAQGRP